MMLHHALKEWAGVCLALAEGRQSLILRKGGIAEPQGEFQPEHRRFWLYPTFTHQQTEGIKPEDASFIARAESERAPAGTVRLSHFAEVAGIYHVQDLVPVLMLGHLHILSEEIVRARFRYRTPGIHVLALRVYQCQQPLDVPEAPAYAGCRTWVELEGALPTEGAVPVISEADFRNLMRTLDTILNPTALA
jgi:hypothetical protein